MADQTYVDLGLGGLGLMIVGLILGFAAVWQMVTELNAVFTSEKIPRWHVFMKFFSNDVITRYAKSFGKSRSAYQILRACWLFMSFGFVLGIGTSLLAKR